MTGWPTLADLFGDKRIVKARSWLGSKGSSTSTAGAEDSVEASAGGGEKQANVIVQLALGCCSLFHDAAGEPYARTNDGMVFRLRAPAFRALLSKLYFDAHHSTSTTTAKSEAIGTLEGIALHGSPRLPVCVRVGEHGGTVYLDLANDAHEVVEITANGWNVVTSCPVNFVRPKGMKPLPVPTCDGEIEDLSDFLNVLRMEDRVLVYSWLVAALRPRGPYAILVFQGRHGSSKSTTSRTLRALSDPNAAPIRTPPREARDLAIAAQNGQVLAFDNLSGVPDWLSDALCRVATGGGFSTRELYTDGEEKLFDAQRPIILNGIDDLLARPDLADRALMVTLPEIPATRRRDEKSLWAAFDEAAPRILGALLDGVARALRDSRRSCSTRSRAWRTSFAGHLLRCRPSASRGRPS